MKLNSDEKSKLYNDTLHQIEKLLLDIDNKLGSKESLLMLSSILKDYDLGTASNLVKANCEPDVCKWVFEDRHFDEGNEEAGFVSLKSILSDYEKILNCDDSNSGIHFTEFVRLETDEEKEENGHSLNVEWFTADESHLIKDTYIGFEDV